jgi:hypothetical protein
MGQKIRFKDPNGSWGPWVDLGGAAKIKQFTQTAGEALAEEQVVYKSVADSEWYIAQNDGTEIEALAIGVVEDSGGISSGSTGTITMFGAVGSGGVTLAVHQPVWLDDAGLPTTTEPTTGFAYKRQIGWSISADEYIFMPPIEDNLVEIINEINIRGFVDRSETSLTLTGASLNTITVVDGGSGWSYL